MRFSAASSKNSVWLGAKILLCVLYVSQQSSQVASTKVSTPINDFCTPKVQDACTAAYNGMTASACLKDIQCPGLISTNYDEDDFNDVSIDSHNQRRVEPYNGSYGVNMVALRYSPDLQASIFNLLLQICVTKKMTHDKNDCRQTPQYSAVGQNLYMCRGKKYEYVNLSTILDQAVNAWNEEKKDVTREQIMSFHRIDPNVKIGHFTQVYWGSTHRVACACVKTADDDATYKIRVYCGCNYAKAGNYLNRPVVDLGPSVGSNCGKYTASNSSAGGLCEVTNDELYRNENNIKPSR